MRPGLEVGDPRLAVVAPALAARFNTAGVLAAADVQVARRLARLCGEQDERLLLATALVVRAVRGGSVCLTLDDREQMLVPEAEDLVGDPATDTPGQRLVDADLPEAAPWSAAIEVSAMVGVGAACDPRPSTALGRWSALPGPVLACRAAGPRAGRRPVVGADARGRPAAGSGVRPPGVRRSGRRTPENSRQRLAAACAAHSRLTVLTGGPGTGKTTTVAGLVAVLQAVAGPGLSVALAAPTGKAAARLQEAVRRQVAELTETDRQRVGRARREHRAPVAGLASGFEHPIPARPHPPPAARRGGRGRDVDGLAAVDGQAARGDPAAGPAGAGRRPRPAGVGGGRRGAR